MASFSVTDATAGERPLRTGEIKPELIFHNYCSVCHGDRGDGRSRARGSLVPPPKDFTTASDLTREKMINAVTYGKPKTAMVSWRTQLTSEEIEAVVEYIRRTFMVVTSDPRLQRGRATYAENCMVCHGERGQGSPVPVGGATPPRDLSSPQSRAELTRERMIASISKGKEGTAMPAFAGRLSAPDIEEVVDYVRAALMVPAPESVSGVRAHGGREGDAASPDGAPKARTVARVEPVEPEKAPFPDGLIGNAVKGKELYMKTCVTCHGKKGAGNGPRAYFINPRPANFTDHKDHQVHTRPGLFETISMGKVGTEMPAWSKVLEKQEIANVAEFVYKNLMGHDKGRSHSHSNSGNHSSHSSNAHAGHKHAGH